MTVQCPVFEAFNTWSPMQLLLCLLFRYYATTSPLLVSCCIRIILPPVVWSGRINTHHNGRHSKPSGILYVNTTVNYICSCEEFLSVIFPKQWHEHLQEKWQFILPESNDTGCMNAITSGLSFLAIISCFWEIYYFTWKIHILHSQRQVQSE